jgi:RimJ/RimL family protein N-acetyltransferase
MQGRSVRLRRIQNKDLNWICQWWQDPELMRYYNRLPIANRCQVEAEIRENIRSQKRRDFVILRNGDTPIGLAYLSKISWKNKNCQVHVMLAEKNARKSSFCGVESVLLLLFYAFRELNMHRVETQTVEYATAAVKALKAVGFQLECQQANFYYQGGEYFFKYTLGLLQQEFEEELERGRLKKYVRFCSALGRTYSAFGFDNAKRANAKCATG